MRPRTSFVLRFRYHDEANVAMFAFIAVQNMFESSHSSARAPAPKDAFSPSTMVPSNLDGGQEVTCNLATTGLISIEVHCGQANILPEPRAMSLQIGLPDANHNTQNLLNAAQIIRNQGRRIGLSTQIHFVIIERQGICASQEISSCEKLLSYPWETGGDRARCIAVVHRQSLDGW